MTDGSEDKKAKKEKKNQNYKSYLEATQLDNKINYLEKRN